MTGAFRRLWPTLAVAADARLLRLRCGEGAAAEARARIDAATRAGALDALRHWTAVWAELMRVAAPLLLPGRHV